MKSLLFGLLNSLSIGTFVTFSFVNPRAVGKRYFVYHGIAAVLLMGLSLGFLGALQNGSAIILLVCAIAFCFFAEKRFALFLYFVAVASAGLFLLQTEPYFLNTLCSTLLLGFSLSAMLLGHWYLIEPKLSIAELKRMCGVLIVLIVCRFCYGTFVVLQLLWGKTEAEIYKILFGSIGIFIMMRWTWGLLAPMVFSYLVWNTVKIRSTQSATGILYVLVLAILTGETLSRYLASTYGIVL